MKANHWVQVTISVVVVTLLAAAGLSYAAPPVSGRAIEFAGGSRERAAAETGQPEAQPGDVPEGLTSDDWAAMQDLLRAAQYQFTWQVRDSAGAYRAPNPAHDLSLAFASNGFTAARYSAEGKPLWDFGLSLAAYGGQVFPAAIAEGGLSGSRERVEYHWSRDVVEWYVNSAEGVEHGLTLAAPPAGTDGSTVELTFALRGSLTPKLDGGGQVLRLRDARGQTALLYDQLAVYDAIGRSLPAHFELARTAQHVLRISIDATSATYPLTVDPLLHDQAAKLTASDAEDDDRFGVSVAISGDTVVVGAYLEDGAGLDRGAAYLFERNQGGADSWGEVTKIAASDAAIYDKFGYSVAINGDTVIVGAHWENGAGIARGAAYLFERNQGGADSWGEVEKLTASDAADGDYFGHSVAISGETIVVGAFGADNYRGTAYLFKRNQGGADNWGEVTKLTASDAANGDCFGRSVAISGDTIVVGAYGEDGVGIYLGAAYLFERNQGGADSWGEVTKLTASDAADGDCFGHSVAISGETVIVGAYLEDVVGLDRGAAYLFERNQGGADSWGEVTKLTASDAVDDDNFGYSVAISGDTIVVGAHEGNEVGDNLGAAYVFERNRGGADDWGEVTKLIASDAADDDTFGISVAISGDTVVVGAYWADGAGLDRGAAYVFVADGGQWQEIAIPRASDAADDDIFGYSVALSGETVVVGAYREDGGAGDPTSNAGAAYVFARNQGGADNWGQVTKLTASDAADGDWFGCSVAISGDTIIVGAWGEDGAGSERGAAYLFERNQDGADNWGEVTNLTASDAEDDDYFGHSVAISGGTVVVGAWGEDGAGSERGAAYLFERNQDGADSWGQVKKLIASDAEDWDLFGDSVAISGGGVVVGADGEDGAGSGRGAAYLFKRNQDGADSWGQVTKLTASDAANGDRFGRSAAISGETVVVGAFGEDGAGSGRGAAYVFERNQGGADSWGEVKELTASDAANNDYFGYSAAVNGDTIVVGAYWEDGAGYDHGAAYVFERNQGGADNWGQVTKMTASDAEDYDFFGYSVAISGDTIVVGAYGEDGAGSNRGAAYVFVLQPYKIYLPLVLKNLP